MPLVSIVIPVYNGAAWVRPCLDSILCQTMGDFELIVVDDASTDETPGILAGYAARDARITVATHGCNTHAGTARNDGMERATGSYLLFLDADDLYDPRLLERAVDCAQAGDADMVLFGADEFEGDPAHARHNPFLLNLPVVPDKRPFNRTDIPDRLFQICTPEPWSKLFRRSFVEHVAPAGHPCGSRGCRTRTTCSLPWRLWPLPSESTSSPMCWSIIVKGPPGEFRHARRKSLLRFSMRWGRLRRTLSKWARSTGSR